MLFEEDGLIRARRGVGVVPGSQVWLWESVLIRDGEPIAQPAGKHPGRTGQLRRRPRRAPENQGRRRHHLAHSPQQRGRPGSRPWRVPQRPAPGQPSRAKLLDLRATDPVLVLTQYVRHANRPFYLAKCLIADRAGHLSVMQSSQS
jgi:GntR family transcriptional regulator